VLVIAKNDGLAHGGGSIQVQCAIERLTISPQDINYTDANSIALQYNQNIEQNTSVSTPWLKTWEATAQASSIIRSIGQGRTSYRQM
jgi:hypothetical protein